jgi:general secretion pathway protein H
MISSRKPGSPEAGFTLIELLVVVAIMAFTLLLIVGFKPPWSRGFDLDTTAAELAGQLRLARSQAIAEDHSVALELDLARHVYRAGTAAARPLPAGLAITLLTIAGQQHGGHAGDIQFNPDGSSTGGRIVLADGPRRVAIGVDWLTGRVTVADVR